MAMRLVSPAGGRIKEGGLCKEERNAYFFYRRTQRFRKEHRGITSIFQDSVLK